jgi:hypothetical protein
MADHCAPRDARVLIDNYQSANGSSPPLTEPTENPLPVAHGRLLSPLEFLDYELVF